MLLLLLLSAILVLNVQTGSATESYKDQYCTDPRTMKKHAAYSEWADAYSCTRHRCQPGGRSLAIYTVGCKRVEAPESAIECEEVVEDTNIQFPYCCTRLRCLVVVRGEVWTRVLGQPWESLPAAPWSHMYKMKKPPPSDASFSKKNEGEGPIYELAAPETRHDDQSGRRMHSSGIPDNFDEGTAHIKPPQDPPDVVIALSSANERSIEPKIHHQRMRKRTQTNNMISGEDCEGGDCEDAPPIKPEKSKPRWAQVAAVQYDNENDAVMETENAAKESFPDTLPDSQKLGSSENKDEKPVHLQALVDAIGTRMRDIENVVQQMSDKVNRAKAMDENGKPEFSGEKKYGERSIIIPQEPESPYGEKKSIKGKKGSLEGDKYRRFNGRNRNKYLTNRNEAVTETPLFMEDGNLNGYFSGSTNLIRRGVPPKEPSEPVYMAPVLESRQNNPLQRSRIPLAISDELESKAKHKRIHKKKKKPMTHHKRHHPRSDLKKSFNKINSIENMVASFEDDSSGG